MLDVSQFAGLGGRNPDVRVKHLVTQLENAPNAPPSHLSAEHFCTVMLIWETLQT